MSRYVTVRMTIEQAYAASNAADLIRDQCEASGRKREAQMYARSCDIIERAIRATGRQIS